MTTLIEPYDEKHENEEHKPERNANVAEPICAFINGISRLVPMDEYAMGVMKSIKKAFEK